MTFRSSVSINSAYVPSLGEWMRSHAQQERLTAAVLKMPTLDWTAVGSRPRNVSNALARMAAR